MDTNHSNKYIAHSFNNEGIEQTMIQHSNGVSEMMRKFALSEIYADIYACCGKIHDIGKYLIENQKHLRNEGDGEPHSKWAAYYAKKKHLMNIAWAILGHHTMLHNIEELFIAFDSCEKEIEKMNYIEQAMKEDGFDDCLVCDNTPFNDIKEPTQRELFVRMLYSSLVDADSLDTERHFNKNQYDLRDSKKLDADKFIEKMNKKFSSFKQEGTINKLRNEVRLYAQSLAYLPQGCFSMTLPTGMGKTLTSFNWALHHAKSHPNIKRIIIVLPFITIIDQTAKELKGIFKDDNVILEHHSDVICDDEKNIEKCRLGIDNWDYPIIVTTDVQFFDSLFSNKRGKCRKLHNIQDSIVIFDEIQTLPMKLSECTMCMLNDMLKLCHCSFLFCTATQPDFQNRNNFKGIDNITSLVKDPQKIFEATKRVEYIPIDNYKQKTTKEIVRHIIEKDDSALVICNTKKKVKELFLELKGQNDIPVFHLSTTMCPKHRKKVISLVKERLRKKEKTILCSTQLVEAGVDIDFPIVYREVAPLESIIQSAGRCNREGTLKLGKVFLFCMTESGSPSLNYDTRTKFSELFYKNNEKRLNDADFFTEYHNKLMKLYPHEDKITKDRMKCNFDDVSTYRLIDNETTTLFIYRYDDESLKLYNEVKDDEYINRHKQQKISQYCVQVYDKFVKVNLDKICENENGLKLWNGLYSDEYGIEDNNIFLDFI